MKTIVAMFDDISHARQAVEELVNAGIDRDRIGLVAGDNEGRYSAELQQGDGDDMGRDVGSGAATGAMIGGLGGLALGLAALAIPGIGQVIAAGPIAAALTGAGVGAVVGGLIGALTEAGVPEEQAGYYAEGVRRGSTLVTVEAPEHRADEVVRILDRHDPIDVDERVSSWRSEGWTGFSEDDTSDAYTTTGMYQDRTSAGYTGAQTGQDRARYGGQSFAGDNEEEVRFEVVEEEVNIGKRQVERGGVRVQSHVEESPVEEQVHLREERVNVERRPVDRPAGAADWQSFEEGSVEVTAISEEPVVEKRARVVEEVVVDKDVQDRTQTVRDTVRRKDVDVQQIDGGSTSSRFADYNIVFRNHWQSNYANSGYTYEQYEPAYRYGYALANDARYQGRNWNEIEANARRTWSQDHSDSPWENFKEAVRHGWHEVKQTVSR